MYIHIGTGHFVHYREVILFKRCNATVGVEMSLIQCPLLEVLITLVEWMALWGECSEGVKTA